MLIPGWPQIEAFPTPLEAGERVVVEAYERLAESLEATDPQLNVYVQPYLENYRPDVVAGIPDNGILIIEVKDWKPESKTSSTQARAAVEQVQFYRHELLSLCAPDISSLVASAELADYEAEITHLLDRSVKVAVAVPFLKREELRALLPHTSTHIIDRDELEALPTLSRPTRLPKTKLPRELQSRVIAALWKSLSSWLTPPYHRAEQGRLSTSQLTKAQRPHGVSRGSGWYRLRGPAGSGKSLVLAHKAAFMAAERKRVLLICFNITLKHYLRDLVARMRYDFAWEHIVIRHFHSLLKEIRLTFDICFTKEEVQRIPSNEFIGKYYPRVVSEILDRHPDHPFRFDAILIDEGQDFPVDWFRILARCLADDGELLIVRDGHQNVYSQDISWSDGDSHSIRGLKGLRGFSGKWAELQTTWRMSPTITGGVSEFAHRVLGAATFNVDPARSDQRELYAGSTFCRWENLREHELDSRLIEVVEQVTRMATPSHPSDFAVLTYTNSLTWHIVQLLKQAEYPAVHVYDSDGKRDKNQLVRFRKGDGRVKVCTGHSFKGYEIWGVILLVSPRKSAVEQARWVYTSMGRAIEGLWVLNADPALDHVREWFPRE